MLLVILSSTVLVAAQRFVRPIFSLNRTQLEEVAAKIPEFSEEQIKILRQNWLANILDENCEWKLEVYNEWFEEKIHMVNLLVNATEQEYPYASVYYEGQNLVEEVVFRISFIDFF